MQIDPRGPQFNAILTSVVLALSLLTAPGTVGVVLLASRRCCSRSAVALGVQRTPAAFLFRTVRASPARRARRTSRTRSPRGSPRGSASPSPLVGLVGYLAGAPVLGAVATGFALAAALLNAVFGFCLGCEMYLLIRRVAPARSTSTTTAHTNA